MLLEIALMPARIGVISVSVLGLILDCTPCMSVLLLGLKSECTPVMFVLLPAPPATSPPIPEWWSMKSLFLLFLRKLRLWTALRLAKEELTVSPKSGELAGELPSDPQENVGVPIEPGDVDNKGAFVWDANRCILPGDVVWGRDLDLDISCGDGVLPFGDLWPNFGDLRPKIGDLPGEDGDPWPEVEVGDPLPAPGFLEMATIQ